MFTLNINKFIEYLKDSSCTMQRNAAVLTVVCILLCFSFNYTFPLHRETTDSRPESFPNSTPQCNVLAHRENIVERSKKMASNIENVFKRFKDSTQDLGKNIYDHVNSGLKGSKEINSLSEEDIRQYEQLVIMKKYPYLDLKDLEGKYNPSNKNVRQSFKFEPGTNAESDPGICEPLEDGPNVEIINRGLSGFAIPPQLSRRVSMVDNKLKYNRVINDGEKLEHVKLAKDALGSLKNEVRQYVARKTNKLT